MKISIVNFIFKKLLNYWKSIVPDLGRATVETILAFLYIFNKKKCKVQFLIPEILIQNYL